MVKELTEVQGIIFKRKKFKEADLLVKIMTKNLGIFTMVVRGALRPKSQLGAVTLNFSYGKYDVYTSKSGLSQLRTSKEVKQYEGLFNDLEKSAYASFILDLIDHAFIEYQPIDGYFDLAKLALEKIEKGQDPEIISQLVELKLLKAYGVEPQLKKCLICGKKQGVFDYSIKLGGVICSQHFAQVENRLHLKAKETALIRTLGLIPLTKLGNVNVKKETKLKTRRAIDRIYRQTVDLNLKSKKFLDEITLLKY